MTSRLYIIHVKVVHVKIKGEGDAQIELECALPKNDQVCLDFAINSKPINKYMPKNKNSFQFKVWKLCTNPYFDNFVLGLICLNTGMSLKATATLLYKDSYLLVSYKS